MKKRRVKSYYTIFLFETVLLFLAILNSFNSSLSNVYVLPFILFICDVIFFFVLGFEKNNKRLNRIVAFDVFMYSMMFLILYYLFGIIIGYAESNNYLTLYGLTIFIIPTILKIVFKEHLRNSLLTKSGNNNFLIIYTVILFIMIDILPSLSILKMSNIHDVFLFIALVLLPSITVNIFATYINIKVGYLPAIIYLLIFSLYQYIIPIVPDPTEYLKAIIDFILPILILLKVRKNVNKYFNEYKEIDRNYNKSAIILLVIPIILTIIIIYFVSGYFMYYALAIASGSMHPVFDRGSVVITEQLNDKYDNYNKLKEGEIIAFKAEKNIVVHRLIRIVNVGNEVYYYTKGDANNEEDNYLIKKENIIGIVRFKIPYIGYPTVWFSEI
ncbi:MAG: signal peptidase I [bacterium]|nr:signal peptidase I [bacterium]